MFDQDGNSPKVKAKMLLEKIVPHVDSLLNAKSLAIVFCTEIINYEFFGSQTQTFWMKVKNEIDKL